MSQSFQFHIGAGLANYSGDIQQRAITTNQARGVLSLGATYQFSERFSVRTDFSHGQIGADDKLVNSIETIGRNLNFESNISELKLVAEYNVLDISSTNWTPYAFAGIGAFSFNPYTYDINGTKVFLQPLRTEGQGLAQFPDRRPYKTTQLNIPLGFGVKYALSEDVHVGAELGFRKIFTDYLDDVSKTYADRDALLAAYGPRSVQFAFRGDERQHNPLEYPQEGEKRGGSVYKDYYYFGQIRLIFRLNWFEASGGGYKGLGCPSRLW